MRRIWLLRIILLLTLGAWFAAYFVQPKIYLFQRGQRSRPSYRLRSAQLPGVISSPHRLYASAGKNSFWLGWERGGSQQAVMEEPYLNFGFTGEDWELARPFFYYQDEPKANQTEYVYYNGSTQPVIRSHGRVTAAERQQTLSIGIPYWLFVAVTLVALVYAEVRYRRRQQPGHAFTLTGLPDAAPHVRSSVTLLNAQRRRAKT